MYDQLGRITSMPTENGTKTASTSYFVNDLVATQEVPGAKRTQWGLDPLMRFDTQDTFEWVNNAWANSTETINHYDGDSDEPSWIVNDATLPDNLTRYVEGMEGALAVQTGKTGERVLQLVDLHGDITATMPIADGATTATFTELRFTSFDEFGIPQPMTSGATSNAPPARYGWLDAAQRNADTPAGVILMGVRLYHPATGRFLSVDPVAGGSANNYDYCNADPVNCTDLGGTWTWKGVVKKIAVVAEVAAIIPGPIGAAAAGVSAVAYAASGNKGKALQMGALAALQTVGAGVAAIAAFKVAKIAAKASEKSRALENAVRSAPIWSQTKKFTPMVNATRHFNKHGRDFGANVTMRAYVQAASRFTNRSTFGTLSRTRPNGDVVKYNPFTNTFGSRAANHAPRTFFKPTSRKQGFREYRRN